MVSLKYLGDRILLGADWLGDWLGPRNVSLRWLEGWGGLAHMSGLVYVRSSD